MIRPGMDLIEELPTGENEVGKVMWICKQGHHGITTLGYEIVCPQCCHNGDVPAGFTCTKCGEIGYRRCPTCGSPRSQPAAERLAAS